MGHAKLVGAVSNCAVLTYHGTYAVRLENEIAGERKCLFIFRIHYNGERSLKCAVIQECLVVCADYHVLQRVCLNLSVGEVRERKCDIMRTRR